MLRQKLQEITVLPVGEHEAAIAELARQYPHGIKVLARNHPQAPRQTEFNCFGFAFNLPDSAEYTDLSKKSGFFADSEFARFLIDKGYLREIKPSEVRPGDIVVYSDRGLIKHAGKCFGEKIVSKWGIGLFYEHGLFEVPEHYGERVRYFRQLSQTEALNAFREYIW